MLVNKKKARQIARTAWIRSLGDKQEAEKIAREEVRYEFGIITYVVVIYYVMSICIKLWEFWSKSNVLIPPNEPMQGEPE